MRNPFKLKVEEQGVILHKILNMKKFLNIQCSNNNIKKQLVSNHSIFFKFLIILQSV